MRSGSPSVPARSSGAPTSSTFIADLAAPRSAGAPGAGAATARSISTPCCASTPRPRPVRPRRRLPGSSCAANWPPPRTRNRSRNRQAERMRATGLPVVVLDGRTLHPAAWWRSRAAAPRPGSAPPRASATAAAERLVCELLERGELLYGMSTGVGVAALRAVRARGPRRPPVAARAQPRGRRRGAAPGEVVRAAMAVRANQIGAGGAGVGDALLDALLGALRAGVTPLARELGSLGTGDLTVLAEIGVALGGEGECWVGDGVVPTAEALAAHGLEPAATAARRHRLHDANAVTSARPRSSTTTPAACWSRARRAALSYGATDADLAVLDPRVHAVRPHRGQVEVARRLRELLGDFEPRERDPGAGSTTRSCSAACRRSRARCSRRSSAWRRCSRSSSTSRARTPDAARATASRCPTGTSTPGC